MENSKETLRVAQIITGRFMELSDDDLNLFASILEKKIYKKGSSILREGQVSNNLLFVNKGLLRQYYFKNGKDITEYFVPEGDNSLSCIESIFLKKESFMSIEALMNSEVYLTPYHKLVELSEQSPMIGRYLRLVLERALLISQEKADSMRFETTQDRYERFIKTHPIVMKYAPLYHIASYLQMTPESLSRARSGQ